MKGLYVQYALFLSDFKKLEFSRHIFENSSNVTDRHDEANGRYLQFYEGLRIGTNVVVVVVVVVVL